MRWEAPRRSSFQQLRSAVAARSGPLVLLGQPQPGAGSVALAFAISKKVGNAVVRNRLRRRLREAARLHLDLGPGIYLVRARPEAVGLSFTELAQHLTKAARALGERAEC